MASAPTSREAWIEQRRTGIGGSDAAAVLGTNPWKSRMELWAEKTGLVEPPDLSNNEAIEFGLRLEGIVLETLADRTGRRIERWPQTEIVRHQKHAWMICTPDAFQWDEQRGSRGIVQAKTTSAFQRKSWDSDEPPLHYQIQIQHEMAVTGCRWGTLCCLVGGQHFAWFDVSRNDRFIEALIRQEREFWRLVEAETPPEPDGTDSCASTLARLYPEETGESVALPPVAAEWDSELIRLREKISEMEKTKQELENRLKAAIGDASIGVLPDGTAWTYRTIHRKGYSVPPKSYRQLRRLNK